MPTATQTYRGVLIGRIRRSWHPLTRTTLRPEHSYSIWLRDAQRRCALSGSAGEGHPTKARLTTLIDHCIAVIGPVPQASTDE